MSADDIRHALGYVNAFGLGGLTVSYIMRWMHLAAIRRLDEQHATELRRATCHHEWQPIREAGIPPSTPVGYCPHCHLKRIGWPEDALGTPSAHHPPDGLSERDSRSRRIGGGVTDVP